MSDGHRLSAALLGLLRGGGGYYSNRISPVEALLRGRRRRIVTSSSTRLGSDVADAARSLFRRRLGGLVVVLIGLALAWLARWRERRSRRQALALESAAVSTIRDSQRVLRGQISDPYTGSTQTGAAPMTPPMAYAVPVTPPQAVPAVAVPVQTCPLGGHALQTYNTEVDGHTCDNCGRRIALCEQIWRCAPCDFDKCASCAASVAATAPQPFAPPAAAVYGAQQEPASAPPLLGVPQQQVGQAGATDATAVPSAPPSVEQANIPTATAWAAPARPIPTDGRALPMFNPAWVGGAVDRVFVHLQGWIWAPDQALVRAPFTGEAVIAYESRVTQEYEVLVRYKHRRKVKSGRRKGAKGKDDPGSDSEYEEEERTRWERRSRTVWSDRRVVDTLYIEDTTGRVRLLPSKGDGSGQLDARAMVLQNPEANIRWAVKFTESVFRDFEYEVPVRASCDVRVMFSGCKVKLRGVWLRVCACDRTRGVRLWQTWHCQCSALNEYAATAALNRWYGAGWHSRALESCRLLGMER